MYSEFGRETLDNYFIAKAVEAVQKTVLLAEGAAVEVEPGEFVVEVPYSETTSNAWLLPALVGVGISFVSYLVNRPLAVFRKSSKSQ